MKKSFILSTLLIASTVIAESQMTFTVKPGFNLNSANIGYKTGNLNPYGGIQFLNAYSSFKDKNDTYDPDDRKTATNIYMPYIGAKYFLFSKASVKGSAGLTVFKPLLWAKEKNHGKETDSYDDLKDISLWGSELYFGSEYYFTENFSIGGEFGFRFALYKDHYESDYSDYEYDEAYHINMTYVAGSMNFYF
jgi:hypothetical protein